MQRSEEKEATRMGPVEGRRPEGVQELGTGACRAEWVWSSEEVGVV